MKKPVYILSFIFLVLVCHKGFTQHRAQDLKFIINVSLNQEEKVLNGIQQLIYKNNSADTLSFIWFHIWANAYKNDRTAYSEDLLDKDRTDFYFSDPDQRGYINGLDFKVNNIHSATEDHPRYIDLIKLLLPSPLTPGETIEITTPFHVQLPYNFTGNGYKNNQYQIKQWNPKPAFYQSPDWEIRPFSLDTNLLSEAGFYDVTIQLPTGCAIDADKAVLLDSMVTTDGSYNYHYISNGLVQDFSWQVEKRIALKKTAKTLSQKKYISDPWDAAYSSFVKKRLSETSNKKAVSLLPVAGYNHYDGLMPGALIHNYHRSDKPFHFLAIPLYGLNSGSLTGLARASYSWPLTESYDIETGLAISRFSYNKTIASIDPEQFAGFLKIAPYVRLNLKEANESAKINRYIQLKHYYINEEAFRYKEVTNGTETVLEAGIAKKTVHLTQLKAAIANSRKLYPYSADLTLEHQQDFVRASFTSHYYFNFSNNVNGLQVRFFAGKLFYTTASTPFKRFETNRYHLNLSGPTGEEDYTYNDYFVGRNEFEGLGSQQMMIRDGAFKVRTDLLSDKVGKTDNWLIATNFSTYIPDKFNPLLILPLKIPLKLFADIGTYAEAWDRNADTERFLFDAGLQVSLFREAVNIYFPLIYSRVFRDYYKSYIGENRFWKTVSFSINLQNLHPRRTIPDVNF